jgi:glycosyltransferase involved in cell wall biosynthesis
LNFTSGIQRVVRELVKYKNQDTESGFWDASYGIFRLEKNDETLDYSKRSESIVNEILLGKKIYLLDTGEFNNQLYGLYESLKEFVEIHTLFYDDIPIRNPEFCDSGTRNGFPIYLKYILSFSKYIYAISETQKSNLISWAKFLEIGQVPTLKVLRLANFCPCVYEDSERRKDPLRRIIVVGTFDRRKNLLALLPILKSIPKNSNLTFDFVGAGGPLLNMLKNIFLKYKGFIIKFHVGISDLALHRLYKNADLMLFLSKAEGFGLPVIEALHHRVPVLINAEPSVMEISGGKGIISVDVDNYKEFSRVFNAISTNPEYLYSLKLETELNSNLDYSWNNTAKELFK